jgi:hypothetical protein
MSASELRIVCSGRGAHRQVTLGRLVYTDSASTPDGSPQVGIRGTENGRASAPATMLLEMSPGGGQKLTMRCNFGCRPLTLGTPRLIAFCRAALTVSVVDVSRLPARLRL